ncbi:hypothetical protein H4582DRAFT_1825094 [Lactarius indigo]|nr:hypothetical protein H4582DRAFT_1825094 [Lactarius indigo]
MNYITPTYSQTLVELNARDPSHSAIEYLAATTIAVINAAIDHSPPIPTAINVRRPEEPAFIRWTTGIVIRSRIRAPILLAALTYLNRVKPYICTNTLKWAEIRLLLGALVVADRYMDDNALSNAQWAVVTKRFTKWQIGQMEREFLSVLNWKLGVSQEDLLTWHDATITPLTPILTASPLPQLAIKTHPFKKKLAAPPKLIHPPFVLRTHPIRRQWRKSLKLPEQKSQIKWRQHRKSKVGNPEEDATFIALLKILEESQSNLADLTTM